MHVLPSLLVLLPCLATKTTLTVDVSDTPTGFPQFWRQCIGSGHAALTLRSDWRDHVRIQQDAIGFRSIRFHGLFDDDMQVATNGARWNWTSIDSTYDFLLSMKMQPYVELSFMPSSLASKNATFLHYHANVSPPRNFTEWGELIEAFGTHLVGRYGLKAVASFKFEVWNEPNLQYPIVNGFWAGSQQDYFRLYRTTVLALKRVSPQIQVGGPTTSAGGWLVGSGDFIRFCLSTDTPVDFIATHGYPDPTVRDSLVQQIAAVREAMRNTTVGGAAGGLKRLPEDTALMFSEYNSGLFGPTTHVEYTNNDSPFSAAFVSSTISRLASSTVAQREGGAAAAYSLDTLSYWEISDVFDEITMDDEQTAAPFHNGYGLISCGGVPKPVFRAFEILSAMPTASIPVVQYAGAGNRSGYDSTGDRMLESASRGEPSVSNLTAMAFPEYGTAEEDGSVNRGQVQGLHVLLTHFIPCPTLHSTTSAAASLKECELQAMVQSQSYVPYNVTIRVNISSIAGAAGVARAATATVRRIDSQHANPRRVWEAMGSPRHLTPLQKQTLLNASELVDEPVAVGSASVGTGASSVLQVELAVPVFGVAAVSVQF
jgi:xylan 1,4-beta-xylosidase